jgi:penicillin-binding protein 1A
MSLASAIPASDNTVFAQLAADIGPDTIKQAAHDMGITSHLDGYYAESIGGLRYGVSPLEMANAFATVSSGGWRNTATALTKVIHPNGTVDVIRPRRRKEFTDGMTAVVLPPMEQVLISGTAAGLGIGCPAGGKTGTTSNNTDVWFVGTTPRLSTAVWVGFPDDTRTLGSSTFGATIPAPIWNQFMSAAKGDFCGDWPEPREAFDGSAYTGTYAGASGGSDDDEYYGDETDGEGDEETADDRDGEQRDGRVEGGYDPDAYARPPQEAPPTPTPAPQPTPPATEGGGAGAPTG